MNHYYKNKLMNLFGFKKSKNLEPTEEDNCKIPEYLYSEICDDCKELGFKCESCSDPYHRRIEDVNVKVSGFAIMDNRKILLNSYYTKLSDRPTDIAKED